MVNSEALLEKEIKNIHRKTWKLDVERDLNLQKVLEEHFRDCLDDDVSIEPGDSYVTFKRPHPAFTYIKEMFYLTIYRPEPIQLGYYTTGANNELWELERLTSLGKVAQRIKENQEKIRQDLDEVKAKFGPLSKQLTGSRYKLEKDLQVLRSEKVEKEKKDLEVKLDLREVVDLGKRNTLHGVRNTEILVDKIQVVDATNSYYIVSTMLNDIPRGKVKVKRQHLIDQIYNFLR